MRILVTGAAGFIGSNLSRELLQKGHSVVGIDNFVQGTKQNIEELLAHPNFRMHECDIRDEKYLEPLVHGADMVFHLAARKIPRYGNALETLDVNGLGSWFVLKLARDAGIGVVAASTSDVYGKNPDVPFREESDLVVGQPTVRRWAYAISKMFEEQLLFALVEDGLPFGVAIRFFGAYGPGQSLDWTGGPVPVFIDAALQESVIEVHGDGHQTRTFTYIHDHIEGLVRLLSSDLTGASVLNLGSSDEVSVLELATLIWTLINPSIRPNIQFVPYSTFGRYEDVTRRVPDTSRAGELLNWAASTSLVAGLRATIAWQLKYRLAQGISIPNAQAKLELCQ